MKILKYLISILPAAALLAFMLTIPGECQDTPVRQAVTSQSPEEQMPPQEVQKPKLDYMSTFLSRSTSPLGLKENEEIRRWLKQPKTAWAIRAGVRHILN
ncbi:MAG: hypothetical protein QME28_02425 [Candidatus Saccharicenans sp.]|nr:hypothetical protein [Candidatus Saccharicenans sp.]